MNHVIEIANYAAAYGIVYSNGKVDTFASKVARAEVLHEIADDDHNWYMSGNGSAAAYCGPGFRPATYPGAIIN
jgi:hypothetical protein